MTSCVRRKFASEREALITSLLGIASWGAATYSERFFLPLANGLTPTRFIIATILIITFMALAFWRKHSFSEWLKITVAITILWLFFYAMIGAFLPEWLSKYNWWFEINPTYLLPMCFIAIFTSTLLAITAFKLVSTAMLELYRLFLEIRRKHSRRGIAP